MAIVANHLVKKKQNIDFECDRKLKVYRNIRQTIFNKDIWVLVVVFLSTWALFVKRQIVG